MKNIVRNLLLLSLVVMFAACGQAAKKDRSKQVKEPTSLNNLKDNNAGELAYKKNCQSCHQRDLGGIPGMYPPLAENKAIEGDKATLIKIVLDGMSGEIEVNGEKYNGVMASYRNLPDAEIAAVLNYIRTGFGNDGDIITAAEVKALR
ncbi:c-type cytochrome [Carboxylicivirga sp. N1Y90]|uniref:c-type cytochrome n=1 Tax=Carboxylicivirga fragile TaxID=3417571 RepID=UPI003D3366DE|nr:cytochrome c [Marinilabiliaceae bacterium N1Y90]